MNIEKCVLNITCESCIEIYSRDYLLDEIIKQWNDPDKQLEFLDWITKAGLRAFYICGRDAEIFDELFFLVGIVASKLTTAAKEKSNFDEKMKRILSGEYLVKIISVESDIESYYSLARIHTICELWKGEPSLYVRGYIDSIIVNDDDNELPIDELIFLLDILISRSTVMEIYGPNFESDLEKFLTPTTVKNLTVVWAYDKNVYDFIQNQIQGKPDYIVSEFLFLMYLYSYKNNML